MIKGVCYHAQCINISITYTHRAWFEVSISRSHILTLNVIDLSLERLWKLRVTQGRREDPIPIQGQFCSEGPGSSLSLASQEAGGLISLSYSILHQPKIDVGLREPLRFLQALFKRQDNHQLGSDTQKAGRESLIPLCQLISCSFLGYIGKCSCVKKRKKEKNRDMNHFRVKKKKKKQNRAWV